ncbi:MAG: XRE family transcriptional regulator [Verrucomicrobia bacterium]|nr:MAG: XRE family transcriptional regulator [Verrucomicrobiota bacterium]
MFTCKASAIITRRLAHLTFTQRSIRTILPNKSRIRNDGKLFSTKPSTLGSLLVAKRKEAGLTQSALAKATQIPRKWLGRWERNRAVPSEEELSKVSQILKLSNSVTLVAKSSMSTFAFK